MEPHHILSSEREKALHEIFKDQSFEARYNELFDDATKSKHFFMTDTRKILATLAGTAGDLYWKRVLKSIDQGASSSFIIEKQEKHKNFIMGDLKKLFAKAHHPETAAEIAYHSIEKIVDIHQELVVDVINNWLAFYLHEIWIMLELGISQFSTYNVYLFEKVEKLWKEKTKGYPELLIEQTSKHLSEVISKTGMLLLSISLDFKKKLNRYIQRMNSEIEHCGAMTPIVARFQLCLLRERIHLKNEQYEKEIFILEIAGKPLKKLFFKHIFDNFEQYPDFDYSDLEIKDDPQIQGQTQSLHEKLSMQIAREIDTRNKSRKQSNDLSNLEKATEEVIIEKKPRGNLSLDQKRAGTFTTTPEEKQIVKFLLKHPSIEKLRLERNQAEMDHLALKVIAEVTEVITPEGQVGKYVRFEGEDEFILIREDEHGNSIASKATNSRSWVHMNLTDFDSSYRATKIIANGTQRVIITRMLLGRMAMSNGAACIGQLIFRLIEGKADFRDMADEFIYDGGYGITLGILSGSFPYFTMGLAWVVGIVAIADLERDPLLTNYTKAKLITGIFAKAGASIGVGMGCAAIGQYLVPIPVVGSLIGAAIGGFSWAAVVSAYNNAVASRLSLEVFYCYILISFKEFDQWEDLQEKTANELIEKYSDTISEFIKIVERFFPHHHMDIKKFKNQMKERVADVNDTMEEIYSTVAMTERKSVDRTFSLAWKSLIGLSFMSYYYFLVRLELAEEKGDEHTRLLSGLEKIADTDHITDKLVRHGLKILGKQAILAKVSAVCSSFLKNHKLVTLFKQKKPKHLANDNKKSDEASPSAKDEKSPHSSVKEKEHSQEHSQEYDGHSLTSVTAKDIELHPRLTELVDPVLMSDCSDSEDEENESDPNKKQRKRQTTFISKLDVLGLFAEKADAKHKAKEEAHSKTKNS